MRRYKSYSRRPRRHRLNAGRFIIFILILLAIAAAAIFGVMFFTHTGVFKPKIDPMPAITPAPYVEPEVVPSADAANVPKAAELTNPKNFEFTTDIEADGQIVPNYQRADALSFPTANEYTTLKGVTTFRGNNYRNGGNYGAAEVTEKKLEKIWDINSGALTKWTGSGWTGQPLIVQWDSDMRQMMNIYDDKKAKETLVEVIYPTMDGKIYFLDLDDGSYTRDPINMGFSVKGTASVDPRGYPLLYVGQGVGMDGEVTWNDTYMYVYSLLDGQVLYKYGAPQKDAFAYRESWQAYDSSPLVAADADTLVWPGENGVLYTTKLNSEFDRAAGTVSVTPSNPVKYRYTTPLNMDDSQGNDKRWWGMESSAVAWKNYIFFTDNGGWLQCVDLNTMQLVYAQDVTDDTDSSLLLEQTENGVFLYTASEVDKQVKEGEEKGTAYVRKLNALTGEILWQVPYECMYVNKIDGGILASPVLGKGNLDGMLFYTIARTGTKDDGKLVAYDKNTGEPIWTHDMDRYGWSSPTPIYTPDGTGYLIQCDNGGNMKLIDGKTGELLNKISLGKNIEATPAIFNNMIVVGTRGEKICGVRIS
ncbi:MAG: PQQ-binding-like beta-propeller repeat protein [Christensenellaceae bacterium]